MTLKISRRKLVALAGAVPALGQQAAAPPSTAGDELKAVEAQNRANADQLAKVKLPMSTEPATRFKA